MGNFVMTNTADTVNVGGDFIMRSSNSHEGKLSAGTLTIGGDFEQIQGNNYNFKTTGTHKVVFTGTEEQKISLDAPDYSQFTNIEINNLNGITLNTSIYVTGSLTDNGLVKGNYAYITKLSQIANGKFSGNICL
jgi:hypothetical protein